ncbi:hypothetical protein [Cellulophaga sp. BC115SP]|uniref:hypothetical protein n=1 Tax=Cellulophaga sp. BC115SP TaxID=2683263 RepID=UPI001412A12F|nr:hypothetical protein [Cellulophaga sp. BC115SP]NBB27909.1 hypothetical protein [Cellulophaga sp. BC115SP]
MIRFETSDLTIELLNESIYRVDSVDNMFSYTKQYSSSDGSQVSSSKIGIKIYQHKELVDSCIIIGIGGVSAITQYSYIIASENILICCGDSVFCLSLPSLELVWNMKLDDITCFQIFKCEDDFLIHGEIEITRIDTEGKIKWKFSGKDIFVSLTQEKAISILPDGVLLTDFEQTKYKIDFDGKLTWTNNSNM